jgi:hypothetical protein
MAGQLPQHQLERKKKFEFRIQTAIAGKPLALTACRMWVYGIKPTSFGFTLPNLCIEVPYGTPSR